MLAKNGQETNETKTGLGIWHPLIIGGTLCMKEQYKICVVWRSEIHKCNVYVK